MTPKYSHYKNNSSNNNNTFFFITMLSCDTRAVSFTMEGEILRLSKMSTSTLFGNTQNVLVLIVFIFLLYILLVIQLKLT